MKCIKQAVSFLVALLLMSFFAAGCKLQTEGLTPTTKPMMAEPAPTPFATPLPIPNLSPSPIEASESPAQAFEETDETHKTPEPVPTANITGSKKAKLSKKQMESVELLLNGAMGMYSDDCISYGGSCLQFFSSVNTLDANDYISFVSKAIDRGLAVHDKITINENIETDSYTYSDVELVVKSAFGVDYTVGEHDGNEYFWQNDGMFQHDDSDAETHEVPEIFDIYQISSNELLIRFDIMKQGDAFSEYAGKAEALFMEDRNSVFGYHFVSLIEIPAASPVFEDASASSYLQSEGSISYAPDNVIDGNYTTAWVQEYGVGQWIKLESKELRSVTGICLAIGDQSAPDDGLIMHSGQPVKVKIEIPDRKPIIKELELAFWQGQYCYLVFGELIETKLIKITILSINDESVGEAVYIAEIVPF